MKTTLVHSKIVLAQPETALGKNAPTHELSAPRARRRAHAARFSNGSVGVRLAYFYNERARCRCAVSRPKPGPEQGRLPPRAVGSSLQAAAGFRARFTDQLVRRTGCCASQGPRARGRGVASLTRELA